MGHLPDSGERESFETGMMREPNMMRGRYDLISPIGLRRLFNVSGGIQTISLYALEQLAIHYERGAEKYAPRNWEKGGYICRYLNSAIRHLSKYICGSRDEDHLSAFVWNVFSIMHTEEMVAAGRLPSKLLDMPDYSYNRYSYVASELNLMKPDLFNDVFECIISYMCGCRDFDYLATAAFIVTVIQERSERCPKAKPSDI